MAKNYNKIYEKISDCLWTELYKDIVDIINIEIKTDDYSGEAIRVLAEYTDKKIQNLITKNVDDEIIRDEIDKFWMEKIPLILEAFDEDSKEYINNKYEHIQLIVEECSEKVKPKEEILYEDDDLKVVVIDGVKKVIYKNKTEEIPEDHPLYVLLNKFFEQV
jgi:hypothetical protein